ncbi:MAG: glycosyltransferase family 4 protein [Nevskia sp.]|nr:glycosyltransferase family 4 protein [Nevskia sp.]
MKVLYLCPLIPALSGSGGKRAVYNHLTALASSPGLSIDAVAIDEEGSGEAWPADLDFISSRVYPRALPRFRSGVRGAVSAVAQLLSSPVPRSVAVMKSKPAIEEIKSLLSGGGYDLIVVDLLKAYALIDELDIQVPIIYLAHNVEATIHVDQWRSSSLWSIRRWFAAVEFLKTRHYENRLLKAATRIVAISSEDMRSGVFKKFSDKLYCWPELPVPQQRQWAYRGTKDILFVGSAKYFPNKDAIEWLVNELMPRINRLDPGVHLKVVGCNREDVAAAGGGGNTEFLGFVSHDVLLALHLTSDLFISPVVLGSGIKIKVLEASACGMPIAATGESLRGVEYLDGIACRIERNADSAAHSIVKLLNSPEALMGMHRGISAALQLATRQRQSLGSLLVHSL